ncbi:MAG: bifunctional folylpolyglutamate synthase/dihydrofolate synthase [Bacteroidetes bacterium]|nr:bifunctional folylpolyglutamate synthase/dihydrofolate synthase [Bacteroidota bacterium]
MNYKETLQYMYDALPMFHRIGSAAYKADLNNTIAICNLLKNPQDKFRSIHVAGTNGKGSTSHMLASILQSAGYKVGLYTSPHLKDFRERIKINGKMIPRKLVIDFVSRYRSDFDRIQPSFFEMTVGLAFDHFAKQKVDIAIIEVGLGGRLDSTNVITPLLSVITNINYDHQNLLGDTLAKIAAEKAGIIKPGIPVVIGETQAEVKSVFTKKAVDCNSRIFFADKFYKLKNYKQESKKGKLYLDADVYRRTKLIISGLRCELPGLYQLKNITTVLMAIDILTCPSPLAPRPLSSVPRPFNISFGHIYKGIANVVSQTGLRGRWQVLNEKPLVVTDTGHNEAGIKEVLKQIRATPHKKLHIVLGMVNDKDIKNILGLLPKGAAYYFCKPRIPRGLNEKELQQQAYRAGLKGLSYNSVKSAYKAARLAAAKTDMVFVGGSTFVVAEVV